MATATILCTQTSFGVGGYGSSDEHTVQVGKADGYTKNARVRFPALNPAWVIKSIKFQFRRNDGDATRVLRFGTNQSSAFDSRNTLDWKKNFSVSSGYAFKTFDFTPYKTIIQAYPGNWYVHITHGSGDRSYCTFNGGGSSNRPRIVVEYEDSSLVVPDDTFIIGEESTFTVGVADSGLTHKLYYSAGSASGQIVVDEVDEFDGGAEVSWTPPVDLAYEVTDTDVGTITITVDTYEGEVLRSSVPFEFNLAVPEDMVPSIDDYSIDLVNPEGDDVGEYVQGRSRAKATIEASSVYGAAIVQYQFEIVTPTNASASLGSDSGEILSNVLTEPGAMKAILKATDTRGRMAELELPSAFTVYPYTPPVVSSLNLARALNDPPDYTESNSGQYIKFTLGCVFSPINGKNTKSGSIRFRPTGGEWSDAFSLDDAMDDWGSTYTFPLQGLLGNDDIGSGSYEVKVTLADRYNTVTQYGELSSRLIWIDRHGSGEGVAIGKTAEIESLFDVGLDSRFDGVVSLGESGKLGNANLANNAAWRAGTSGWLLSANVARDKAVTLNGGCSLKCNQTGLSSPAWYGAGLADASRAACAAGDVFSASVYVLVQDSATFDSTLSLELQVFDASGTRVQTNSAVLTPASADDGKWLRMEVNGATITAANAATCNIRFYVRQNGVVWFACPKLEKGPIATEFVASVEGDVAFKGAPTYADPSAAIANLFPYCRLSNPTGDTISYNADNRRAWVLNFKTITRCDNGLYEILMGGSDATRQMGWVIPMDGIYRVILAFRATTNTSDGHMGIARLPDTWTPPSANYMLRDTMLGQQIEGTSQYVSRLTTSTGHLSGNMTYDFSADEGDKIWPWLCMLDANKTLLSNETWASIQKIG